MRYWLIKSEPHVYPFSQLVREKKTAWTGVRNFEARNNLRAMSLGDLALYYHSGDGKEIVGIAEVVSAPKADDTAPNEDWAAVDFAPVMALKTPVTLKTVKATTALKDFQLVTRSRLSVAQVSAAHFKKILSMGKTQLPRGA